MQLKVAADAAAAARIAAAEMGAACREAVAVRGRAMLAVSGGETPWLMLRELRTLDLPWPRILVAQVDERVAPEGDPRRNFARLEQILLRDGPLAAAQVLRMPVESRDLEKAATAYQRLLESAGGAPLAFDVVQLGLGTDGHTASLVPNDAVLEVLDRDVAVTSAYQGLRRMTLTFPAINRARHRLWLVTGAAKSARLRELEKGTLPVSDKGTLPISDKGTSPISTSTETGDVPFLSSLPFLRVRRDDTIVVADEAAIRGDPSPG